jgi:hypothetical protein
MIDSDAAKPSQANHEREKFERGQLQILWQDDSQLFSLHTPKAD